MQAKSEDHPALAGCLDAAERCLQLVRTLTPEQYARKLPDHDAIGSHMRHCLDYYLCLLRGLDSGLVDYDARDRDAAVASDPSVFENRLEQVMGRLRSVAAARREDKLQLRQTVAADGRSWTVETSLDRELVFLSGHCVHHLAIASLLAQLMGVDVAPDLGTAYSTQVYRRSAPSS